MMASQRSTGKSSTIATCWMPALLTRMSQLPNSASQARIMVLDLAGLAHVGAVVDRPGAPERGAPRPAGRSTSPKPLSITLRALRAPGPGNAQADAAGGAGDEGGLAFEHVRISRWRVVTMRALSQRCPAEDDRTACRTPPAPRAVPGQPRPAPHGLLGVGRRRQPARAGLRARPGAPGPRLRHAGARPVRPTTAWSAPTWWAAAAVRLAGRPDGLRDPDLRGRHGDAAGAAGRARGATGSAPRWAG